MPRLGLASPFGDLVLTAANGALTELTWGGSAAGDPSDLLVEAKRQLLAYFAGKRHAFDLPLAPSGAPLDLRVWSLMRDIPYGQTRSYGDLARVLDWPARAVGRACGRNPLPILIPCHRIIGSTGELGGYSGEGGVDTKRRLLLLEGALLV